VGVDLIAVRGDSAVKLVDGLAGESPASAGYPVGTVVISGDGAGDQTVGSPDVRAEQRVVQEGALVKKVVFVAEVLPFVGQKFQLFR